MHAARDEEGKGEEAEERRRGRRGRRRRRGKRQDQIVKFSAGMRARVRHADDKIELTCT